MAVKAGERMSFDGSTGEVVVTKGGDGELKVDASSDTQMQVGKRYRSEETGIEVLVTKKGEGQLTCNGAPMELLQPKKTASAD